MSSSPEIVQHEHLDATAPFETRRTWILVPYALALLISVGLLVYAEIRSFVWDEGFHLVAAQLIAAGKRPYLDFCFPQTPLNAYWNAAWMRLFGQSWRVPHLFATLLTVAACLLVTQFLSSRLAAARWRVACTTVGMLSVALSITVVEYGTIAQAYAMCLFTTFAAFRVAIAAVDRKAAWLAGGAGVLAGAAAASSLLSAPVAPVLLLWILLENQSGSRWRNALSFCVGVVIPLAPVLWLFVQSPYAVFFNVVQYQSLFRRVNWGDAVSHDVDVLSSWVDSGQTLFLTFLAIAGLIFIAKQSGWTARTRREFYLCGWISVALIAFISTAHPTFSRYFVVAVPFMAALAAPGLYAAGGRLVSPTRPFWPTFTVALIFSVALGRELFNNRDSASWQRYERIAKKVSDVTKRQSLLFADEPVYFLLRWTPPSGLEFSYSHKIQLSREQEAKLHIISQAELKQQVQKGRYATLETCDDDRIDDWQLDKVYKQRADLEDCSVFWDFNPAAHLTDETKK